MTATVFRVDRFHVPASVRQEFVDQVRRTHDLLRTLDGFDHDHLLEQDGGPDEITVVTLAAWRDQDALRAAGEAVRATRRETGFDPAAFMDSLGVRAELGDYRELA